MIGRLARVHRGYQQTGTGFWKAIAVELWLWVQAMQLIASPAYSRSKTQAQDYGPY